MNASEFMPAVSWIEGQPYIREDRLSPEGQFLYRHLLSHETFIFERAEGSSPRLRRFEDSAPTLDLSAWVQRAMRP